MKNIRKILIMSGLSLLILSKMNIDRIEAKEDNKDTINTTYITMDTLTDNKKETILNDVEIENFIKEKMNNNFKEIYSYNINHFERKINIEFIVNDEDGDIKTIVNDNIYNFLKDTKKINYYNYEFGVIVRLKDINGRYYKQEMYSYYYSKETLANIKWKKVKQDKFLNIADKHWSIEEGVKEKSIKEDELRIRIINIIKDYFKYKTSNSQ